MITSDKNLHEAVLDFGKQTKADLILIMTQQEKKLKETLLGAYAAHIVNRSEVAVLSIKPVKEYKSSSFEGAHFG